MGLLWAEKPLKFGYLGLPWRLGRCYNGMAGAWRLESRPPRRRRAAAAKAGTQSAIDQPTYLQIRHFTFRGYFPSVNRHDITLSSFYYQDFFQKCPTAAGYCAFFLSRNVPETLASGAATEGVLWLFAVVLIRFCSCLPFFTENKLIYWEIGRPIGNIAGCCEFF